MNPKLYPFHISIIFSVITIIILLVWSNMLVIISEGYFTCSIIEYDNNIIDNSTIIFYLLFQIENHRQYIQYYDYNIIINNYIERKSVFYIGIDGLNNEIIFEQFIINSTINSIFLNIEIVELSTNNHIIVSQEIPILLDLI